MVAPLEDAECLEVFGVKGWEAFVADNRDALLEDFVTLEDARKAAVEGFHMGGGAAPLFYIKLQDYPE